MGRTLPSTSRRDPVENDSLRQLGPNSSLSAGWCLLFFCGFGRRLPLLAPVQHLFSCFDVCGEEFRKIAETLGGGCIVGEFLGFAQGPDERAGTFVTRSQELFEAACGFHEESSIARLGDSACQSP